jgi:LPS-assembly protein
MLKSVALLAPVLLVPALFAQVLPDQDEAPVPGVIEPVAEPAIPFGEPGLEAMAMPKQLNILSSGTIEFINEQSFRYGGPGVKITGDNGMEIFADSAVVDFKAETATLEGNVTVYQGNLMQRGERAVYYYEKKFLDASGLRVSVDPVLLEAGKFTVEQRDGELVYVGHDAGLTTHDVEDPNFWVRSKKTTVYPGEKIVFENLRLYAGDTPVFWLPYLNQSLDGELGYHFVPGGRSNWGPYVLNTYGLMLGGKTDPLTGENTDAWLLSRWRFDIRGRRGIGAGVNFSDTRLGASEELTGLGIYYLNDLNPDISRSGVPRGPVNEDRYEFKLKHRWTPKFPDDADWRIDSNLTWLSDRHYLEDFETTRYRTDPAPDNTLGIYRRSDASLLSLFTRVRLNDFYRSDTRLPELAYDRARAPLFGSRILHEGSTAVGYIGEEAPDFTRRNIINPLMTMDPKSPEARRLLEQLGGYERNLALRMMALPAGDPKRESIRTQLLDSSYGRFRTYQEFSLPMMLGGFLSLTPEAGVGYTRYGAVDGPESGFDKTLLFAGLESSVKFSREMPGYVSHAWGLDGLLHVVQPYGAWSVTSTNDFEAGDPGVDRLTPTTRPRPLDPLRFTATDQLESWNVVRLGARNRLLTRRDGQSFEWLFMDTYMDTFIEDPEGSREFSNLYNDVRWQPLPWLGVDFETQFPVDGDGSGFREYATRLNFMPSDSFECSLGYRILNGHPVLLDSNRCDFQTYTRLSENWGIGTRHVLELDDSTLELQQYTFHRDLGNWVAGVGLSRRDNRLETETGVVFSLTLKDFPSLSLPFEIDAQ